MDQFNALNGDATAVSLQEVLDSHVYVGIIAWRYGYVPHPEQDLRSVTSLEYLKAKELNLPRYLFLAHPATDQLDGPDAPFPASSRDPRYREQLLAFRQEIERERVVDYFTTPDELATKVVASLSGYLLKIREAELLRGPRPPHNLPPRPPAFVGRERELDILCMTLLKRQSVGLAAAVAGMGGVGKSALAAEGYPCSGTRPGGVPWGHYLGALR